MRFTELDTRMKQYEQCNTSAKLMPGLPVLARIDGRAFHTFCKNLPKPFCLELVETMQEVCKFLMESTNADLGYTQSDEITIGWLNTDKIGFSQRLFKLISVLSSMATSKFIGYIYTNKDKSPIWNLLATKCESCPSFDCRVFQVPNKEEFANIFIWRELDATKNSIQCLAQSQFNHEELQGLDSNDLQNKLLIERNINWNDLPAYLKRGTYFKPLKVDKYIDEETWVKIPIIYRPQQRVVQRTKISKFEPPLPKDITRKNLLL